ncbi:MAG: hypothetical protein MI723_13815, partial [Caulobacterales bacterium]|nr:hypothetical protein [Caulobacterales bacterium]
MLQRVLWRLMRASDHVLADTVTRPRLIRAASRRAAGFTGDVCSGLIARPRLRAARLSNGRHSVMVVGGLAARRTVCQLFFAREAAEEDLGPA